MCGPAFPSVGDPGLPDQAADGDDRVGEVEEGVDDILVSLVAALQPVRTFRGLMPDWSPGLG
jgi:hypothetical protein